MRVNKELSHNRYHSRHRRKSLDRLKRRNHRHDEHHHSINNGNSSSRIALNSHNRRRYEEDYSSMPISNRKDDLDLFYYENSKLPSSSSSSSSRYDHLKNNTDVYSSLLTNQKSSCDDPCSDVVFYKASESVPNRDLTSHYIDSKRSRYLSPSSSTYRRDNSHSLSSPSTYRNEYSCRNSNGNDLYIRDEYRTPTPPIAVVPVSVRTTVDSYKDVYRPSDYNNRSQQFDIESNRSNSLRVYHHSTTPIQSSIHRSDSYRTSSAIRMSSPNSYPSLPSSCCSSSYITHDQYNKPSFPSIRENEYRTRDYGMTTSIDHRQVVTNDYCLPSSYRDRSNLKRSRSNFDENEFKRPMRR